jgi:hypothetical protein
MNSNFDSINVQQRRPGGFEDQQPSTSGAQQPFNGLFNQAVASSVGAYVYIQLNFEIDQYFFKHFHNFHVI